jgi:hypothetical protein
MVARKRGNEWGSAAQYEDEEELGCLSCLRATITQKNIRPEENGMSDGTLERAGTGEPDCKRLKKKARGVGGDGILRSI